MAEMVWIVLPNDVPGYRHVFDTAETNTLNELQRLCANGGFVERVQITETLDMWVDEDGLMKQLPANLPATVLVSTILKRPLNQFFCGTVVFASHDYEGEITSCPAGTILDLLNYSE